MSKTLTGTFKNPDGSAVANGTLYMKLSQDAVVSGSGIIAPTLLTFPLDANGTLGSGVTLFANDELTPAGTVYTVTVVTAGGGQVYGPEFFSIAGASPISFNSLSPASGSPVVFSAAVLQNPTAPQTITGQGLTLTASAPLTVQGQLLGTSQNTFTFNAGGVQAWFKLGTWVASAQGNDLRIDFGGGSTFGSGNSSAGRAEITLRSGNATSAPNLAGVLWTERMGSSISGQNTPAIVNVKVAATGGSTSISNNSWDIFVLLNPFSAGPWTFNYSQGDTFTFSGISASDPGAASSTVVVGTAGWFLPSTAPFTLLGATSGGTTIAVAAVAGNSTVTLPASTDTLVGRATIDTLTNKTATGASNGNNLTLLNAQANAGAITGTGAPATVYTYTLPANTVANLKGFRLTVGLNHSTGVASVQYVLSLNGANMLVVSSATTGATSAQYVFLNTGGTNGTISGPTNLFGGAVPAIAVGSLAWTSSQVLTLTFNVAATDQVTPIQWLVELIQ